MPLVIEVIQGVDHPEPWIARVAIRLVECPTFAATGEATQLLDKESAVPAIVRQPGVTHLVNQHPPFGLRWKAALNDDATTRRFVEAVAAMEAYEKGGTPHRAPGDTAVEEVGVQIIEESF